MHSLGLEELVQVFEEFFVFFDAAFAGQADVEFHGTESVRSDALGNDAAMRFCEDGGNPSFFCFRSLDFDDLRLGVTARAVGHVETALCFLFRILAGYFIKHVELPAVFRERDGGGFFCLEFSEHACGFAFPGLSEELDFFSRVRGARVSARDAEQGRDKA